MFQERENLRILGGLLWEDSPGGFLPLAYVLFPVFHPALKNLMNELEVTRAIHQDNSEHHPKIEVLLENTDDLHHLQINVSNPHIYEPVQLETVIQAELFHGASACSAFAAPSRTPSHGRAVNGRSMVQ